MKPSARGLDQAAGRNTSDGYYDSRFLAQAIKILPGEFRATGEDLMLVTVLGSCVAACVHDPVALVGGMNHFMLPEGPDGSLGGDSARYGSYAMEVLINELFKLGARRFGEHSILMIAGRIWESLDLEAKLVLSRTCAEEKIFGLTEVASFDADSLKAVEVGSSAWVAQFNSMALEAARLAGSEAK